MTAVWRPAPPGSSGGLILPGTGTGTIRRRANGRGGGVRVSNPPPPPLRGATSPSREGFEEFQQADFRGRQALAGQGPLQSAERIARVRFYSFEQLRVHIGFAADRGGVAERL